MESPRTPCRPPCGAAERPAPPSAGTGAAAGAERDADRQPGNRPRTQRPAAAGDGLGRPVAARRQPPCGPWAVAPHLLGDVGAVRAAVPLAGPFRMGRIGAGGHHDADPHAAGAACLPEGLVERTLRRRRRCLPALGGAGPAFRLCRLRALRGDPLVCGLHLRVHRGPLGRAPHGRPLCRDAVPRRADALPADARPLGGSPREGFADSRDPAELGLHPGRRRLCRGAVPLPAENPLHVDAPRRGCGLPGLRLHDDGPCGQGPAPASRKAHPRLVLRPLQPSVAAARGPVLGRRRTACR